MIGLNQLLGQRHVLLSTIVGAVGAMIPLSAANAQGTPSAPAPSPAPGPVETLSPKTSVTVSGSAGSAFIAATSEAASATDQSIRPFKFHATDEQLADLKSRVKSARWPSRELVNDVTQGVQLETMRKLADYWANQYDWRKIEARMNALPMFITNIDGLDIHFIHVKSKHPKALPIIITHGWPGSVVEQLKIIDPLVDPTAHGGKA
jgi:hypothetical protein